MITFSGSVISVVISLFDMRNQLNKWHYLILAMVTLAFVAYPWFVGWNYRTTRFEAGLRIVAETQGRYTGESDWFAYSETVQLGENIDIETATEIIEYLMAGRIGTLDFSKTQLQPSEIEGIPNWQFIAAKRILWSNR